MAGTPEREYLACRYSVRGRTGFGLWDACSLCDFGPFSLHRGSGDGIRVDGLLDPAIAVIGGPSRTRVLGTVRRKDEPVSARFGAEIGQVIR